MGDRIIIQSYLGTWGKLFTKGGSKIELIEATYVELKGVTAQTVNGSRVVIGPKCQIEHLDCNGTLSIDPSATVQHITGESVSYTHLPVVWVLWTQVTCMKCMQ